MRSHHFRCRTGAVAPVLTVAEYALIRPAVPVIPGRQDQMRRPSYVPVNAHYVNPPREWANPIWRLRRIVIGALVGILFGMAILLMIHMGRTVPAAPPAPGFTTNPASVPTTYGPPPAGRP